MCVLLWQSVCAGANMDGSHMLFVGSIGMIRCAVKKNEPLSIHRACLRLCVSMKQRKRR